PDRDDDTEREDRHERDRIMVREERGGVAERGEAPCPVLRVLREVLARGSGEEANARREACRVEDRAVEDEDEHDADDDEPDRLAEELAERTGAAPVQSPR